MKRKKIIFLVSLFGILIAINFLFINKKKKLHKERLMPSKLKSVEQSKKNLLKTSYQTKIKILKGKNIPPLKKEKEKMLFSQIEKKEKSSFTPSFYKMFDEEIEMLIKDKKGKLKATKNQDIIPPLKIFKEFREKRVIIY